MRAGLLRAAIVWLLVTGSGSPLPSQSRPAGTTRIDLQRHDLSVPGREVWQLRVTFLPGASFPRHRHPGEEIIYVLEGVVEYDVDGKPPVTLKAGDVLFVPYGVVHAARNVGSTPAAELGTYVVEKGKPLTEIVQ
jgi:quercetin dioxygenase-like cupin family protein